MGGPSTRVKGKGMNRRQMSDMTLMLPEEVLTVSIFNVGRISGGAIK